MPRTDARAISVWDRRLLTTAAADSLRKLDPRAMARNPVMFVVEVGSVLTTLVWLRDVLGPGDSATPAWFTGQVALWLWFTVLFANVSEALAEGRGKAQAAALRGLREETVARRIAAGREEMVPASGLHRGDLVVVEAGGIIPGDGEVVEGIASVDESPVTGESAPVIRESGGDRSAVTGGTRVLSDRIVIRISAEPGSSFIDRMIALVEGAKRGRTPNEIALQVLLAGMTILFLIACVTLVPFGVYSGLRFAVPVIVAFLVCLIPTTIGGLVSAIGIAGMDRLIRHNVIPTSGRAVEAAGDVDTILLDKTGTITLGNRVATEFVPAPGVSAESRGRDAGGSIDRRPREGALRSAPAGGGRHSAFRPVYRADPDERLRPRRTGPAQRGGGRGRAACRRSRRRGPAGDRAHRHRHRPVGWHPPGGVGRLPPDRRRALEGRGEGGAPGTLRALARHGDPNSDDHRG